MQANTPYPATPALSAWLQRRGFAVAQVDLSLELILRVFSPSGVRAMIADLAALPPRRRSVSVRHALKHAAGLPRLAGLAVRLLRGRAPQYMGAIAAGTVFPAGPRFAHADFTASSLTPEDRARHFASLFLDDLADAIREGIDPRFGLARYAEHLAVAALSFDPLRDALTSHTPTHIDRWIDALADRAWRRHRPSLVGLTIPFPGTLYGALRIARRFRRHDPGVRIVAGGGYVSTELRAVRDARLFDYVDAVALDDGEPTLDALARLGNRPLSQLCGARVLARQGDKVLAVGTHPVAPPHHDRRPVPSYRGLDLSHYLPMAESANPMHRLWSDRRWIKLQLAHGCYWHRCAFCDTSLDYIRRFDPARPETIRRWIERLVRETGECGFHFVDEAAPPALLKRLAELLIARGPKIQWWANIRFERSFTPETARLLAQSGCLALTGGLETAGDRTLTKMNKGVTLAQAAQVTHALSAEGILVHAYLMYGFPGQTVGETVDALEFVRQLFEAGCLHSAFWHRFALTVHSPIHADPKAFGVLPSSPACVDFACNEVAFRDLNVKALPSWLGEGLRAAVYNYMHGLGLDRRVRGWFAGRVPAPRLPGDFVVRAVGVR